MKRIVPVLALLSLLGAISCDDDQTFIIPDKNVTDTFFQDPAQLVDILLVLDNSCSMLAEQEKLSEEFGSFTEFFYIANTDYHIGVTTTDMDPDGEQGRLVGPVIDRATTNPGQVFQDTVLVGTNGSGMEQGLLATKAALGPALQAGGNAGFLREDAHLSVIIMSDEDDSSQGPVSDYLHEFFEIKGQRAREAFQVSVLVGVDPLTLAPASCGRDPSDLFAGADDAPRYVDVALRSGGMARSICETDFGAVVAEMGLAASRLSDRYYLSETPEDPQPGALDVTIYIPGTPEFLQDGIPLLPSGLIETGQYAWVLETDGDLYWIRFTDIYDLPPIGSRFTIHYLKSLSR